MQCMSTHPAEFGPSCEGSEGHEGNHHAVVPTDDYFTTLLWPNLDRRRAREAERVQHPEWCPAWWNTINDLFPCDCGRAEALRATQTTDTR